MQDQKEVQDPEEDFEEFQSSVEPENVISQTAVRISHQNGPEYILERRHLLKFYLKMTEMRVEILMTVSQVLLR